MQELRDMLFTGGLACSLRGKLLGWYERRSTTKHTHCSPLPNSADTKAASTLALRLAESTLAAVDLSHFAKVYEHSLLAMNKFTPHQQEKHDECIEPGAGVPAGDVSLRGPAGSGKTFVAMHVVLRALAKEGTANVLFVVQNTALA
jgi:hypothetical protein